MSAADYLGRQFFHTTEEWKLKPGEELRSAEHMGLKDIEGRPNGHLYDPSSIYVHDIDPRGSGTSDLDAYVQNQTATYRVHVEGPMEPDPDPFFKGHGWKVKKARVVEHVW